MKIVEATISTISGSLQAFVSAMGLIYPANLIAGGIAAGIVAAFGAAQIAMIASQSPPPMFAEGGIATGPSIFGEKGKEMATPLEGAEGRKAIGFIADEIAGRLSMGEKETAPTATIIDEEASPVTGESGDLIMKGDVYLDGDLVGEWIGKGTKDGNIKINSRAIVS